MQNRRKRNGTLGKTFPGSVWVTEGPKKDDLEPLLKRRARIMEQDKVGKSRFLLGEINPDVGKGKGRDTLTPPKGRKGGGDKRKKVQG